jgi:hypothetical protein
MRHTTSARTFIPPFIWPELLSLACESQGVIIACATNRWHHLEKGWQPKPLAIKAKTQAHHNAHAPGLIEAHQLSSKELAFIQDESNDYHIGPLCLTQSQLNSLYSSMGDHCPLTFTAITDHHFLVYNQLNAPIRVLKKNNIPVSSDIHLLALLPSWNNLEQGIDAPVRVGINRCNKTWAVSRGEQTKEKENLNTVTRQFLDLSLRFWAQKGRPNPIVQNSDAFNPQSAKIKFPLTAFVPEGKVNLRRHGYHYQNLGGVFILKNTSELMRFKSAIQSYYAFLPNPRWHDIQSPIRYYIQIKKQLELMLAHKHAIATVNPIHDNATRTHAPPILSWQQLNALDKRYFLINLIETQGSLQLGHDNQYSLLPSSNGSSKAMVFIFFNDIATLIETVKRKALPNRKVLPLQTARFPAQLKTVTHNKEDKVKRYPTRSRNGKQAPRNKLCLGGPFSRQTTRIAPV